MKFSIRDLLLTTFIVALAVAWWLDRRCLISAYQSNDGLMMRLRDENSSLVRKFDEQTDIAHAFQSTLDSIHPGWRDADGRFSVENTEDGGWRVLFVPSSQAPTPNPPKP